MHGLIQGERMAKFLHSFAVESDIDKVWRFYTNINHLLIITPKEMKLEILTNQVTPIQEGTECSFRAKLVTNTIWRSKIAHLGNYEYVDEMIGGKFKTWKHLHKFNRLSNGRTEVIDQIDFELPLGIFGKVFESYVIRRLSAIFEYRKKKTMEVMQNTS